MCCTAESDLLVETLQFYFRPSHTQWERSRNVSPFNCSFSGLVKICASVGKKSPTLDFRNTPPAIITSET